MKPGATLLLIEPSGHVTNQEFDRELEIAAGAGLPLAERSSIRRSHAAVLKKS